MLLLTQKMESLEAEARNAFGGRTRAATEWQAMVITNPIIRVSTKFIDRVNQHQRRQVFDTEAEALRWLDARASEDAEKAKQGGS